MEIENVVEPLKWRLVHSRVLPGREGEFLGFTDLSLSIPTRKFLEGFREGIYRHQKLALEALLSGQDVCLATGTASGKSLVFYVTGIETLVTDPAACVVAIYPMKALAREQEGRWRDALAVAGLPVEVGRIDGSVAQRDRARILRKSGVILMTPDVLHAWLLSNVSQPEIKQFLARVRLLVADEVHVYTGVFGSNAAFLYRRFLHAVDALSGGAAVRCLGASATISEPGAHLKRLFSRDFHIIGPEEDSSPRHPLDIRFIQPPEGQDLNTAVPRLLAALSRQEGSRFIAFVDSRRQTERLATILAREGSGDKDHTSPQDSRQDHINVLPYRAGYEEEDRVQIQERLAAGELAGVISTSALELGLDIPGLTVAVLVGVPNTATSFQQRIGRVGRHAPGTILTVNAGGLYDEIVFDDPERLFDRPLAQPALYLHNRRVQYIHALCFAGPGGEYDALEGTAAGVPGLDSAEEEIASRIDWPGGFLKLCRDERMGLIPPDLQSMKVEAGNQPWYVYPLRDVGIQFQVEMRSHDLDRLGSLSFAQVMREAYPGAVYYYLTRPYRVTRIQLQAKKIVVKPERHYTTDPAAMPAMLHPQLDGDGVHGARKYGQLAVVESDLYVSEAVLGYEERRGNTVQKVPYPCPYWNRDRFSRNYFSTGVLITHPAFNRPAVQRDSLARLLLEGFLLVVPFDRNDVACGEGRYRQSDLGFIPGDRFIALYDQVYGSLRLTGHAMEDEILRATIREALNAAHSGSVDVLGSINEATVRVLEELADVVQSSGQPLSWTGPQTALPEIAVSRDTPLVILPGSSGLLLTEANQEFVIEAVFFHPKEGLRYRGRRAGDRNQKVVSTFPIELVQPIPGVSQVGVYDYDTGDVRLLAGDE